MLCSGQKTKHEKFAGLVQAIQWNLINACKAKENRAFVFNFSRHTNRIASAPGMVLYRRRSSQSAEKTRAGEKAPTPGPDDREQSDHR